MLFVNSGILGHRAVARLMKPLTTAHPCFQAEYLDLSEDLTLYDRAIRRALSLRLAPLTGRAANLDFRRWRQEVNVGWLAARRIRAIERRSASGPFDVLHFHPQATAYSSLRRMTRTPSIVSIDATARLAIDESSAGLARMSHRVGIAHDGAVFRRARTIISTSEWAARDVAALYPDCAGKVHVMPYPIDLSRFGAAWIDDRAARAAGRGGPVRALFVGGDFPRKGGADLLNAWRESGLADRAVLDLVTDWPLRLEDLPAGVNVIRGMSPYTPPWFELWRRADLFVMPTRHEAFGMVYQEAAAAGIPAIATGIHAVPEIVQHERTGLLVHPGDRKALVEAIRALVDSSDLRQRLGRAARARISTIADPAMYSSKLGELVKHMVTSNGQPS